MSNHHRRWLSVGLGCVIVSGSSSLALDRYVDVNSVAPSPPYTNWATAADVIQDAVDAADPGDEVWVTNGVYSTGGASQSGSNRVAIMEAVHLRSVNGPAVTTIDGLGEARCLYLHGDAIVTGFTLTGGTGISGGGVNCRRFRNNLLVNCMITSNAATSAGGALYGTLVDCDLVGNEALTKGGGSGNSRLVRCRVLENSAEDGGGCYGGSLTDCVVAGNTASRYGGGCYAARITNSTVAFNAADVAGGGNYALNAVMNNTIIYYNTAPTNANWGGGKINYVCTPTLLYGSVGVVGNITNAPRFVDTNDWANLRLQSNSPCINAGLNQVVSESVDLDENPRIAGGTVDIGAYEYPNPDSIISYSWLQNYGLPTDGSADFESADSDLHTNWEEWIARTDPTNGMSVLSLMDIQSLTNGTRISWQSTGIYYFFERADQLDGPYSVLKTNHFGGFGTAAWTDTTATNGAAYYYRVGIEVP